MRHKMKTQKDYTGLFFQAAEECGAFMHIAYGKIAAHPTPEWIILPHTRYDGIGGLVHLLQQNGYKLLHDIPKIKHKHGLPLSKKIKMFLQVMLSHKKTETTNIWKQYDEKEVLHGQPRDIAYHFFNEADTSSLLSSAKALHVSVNTFLMWHLNQAIRKSLIKNDVPDQHIGDWLIPINLRGAVNKTNPTANHSSGFLITIPSNTAMDDLHQIIHHEIKTQSFWGQWWLINFARVIGTKKIKQVFSEDMLTVRNVIGTFSNLGQFHFPTTANDPLQAWLFCPPVTAHRPVSAGCVTCNGKLSITLQLHRVLSTSTEMTQRCFNEWLSSVQNTI